MAKPTSIFFLLLLAAAAHFEGFDGNELDDDDDRSFSLPQTPSSISSLTAEYESSLPPPVQSQPSDSSAESHNPALDDWDEDEFEGIPSQNPNPDPSSPSGTSSWARDLDSVKKPIPNSTVSVETTPWRQQEKCHVQPKEELKKQSFYYDEVEKRLKDPELRNSIKDLRTVQQLLDAMQTKRFTETKKSGEKNQKVVPLGKHESPIVIMKPAKSVKILGASSTSSVRRSEGLLDKKLRNNDPIDTKKAKNQTSGASFRELSNRRTSERIEDKPRSRSTRENGGSSLKTSGSLSPRLQQKRIEGEKSRSPLPPSDSSKPQKLFANRMSLESVSPRSKLRQKPAQVRDRDGQLGKRIERKNSGYQGDDISQRSDSTISLASQSDIILKQK